MHELGTFAIVYPCWALLHKDCVVRNGAGKPVNVKVPIKLLTLDDTSGGGMLPLFTDEDLAKRYMAESGDMSDFVAYPLMTKRVLLDCLRMSREYADALTLDKPKFGGKPFAIWPLDYAIERIDADKDL